MKTATGPKEGTQSGGAGVQTGPASVWRLAWECYQSLVLALVVGVVAIPALYLSVTTRFRSYAEVVYEVGDSPSAESRVVDWANRSPVWKVSVVNGKARICGRAGNTEGANNPRQCAMFAAAHFSDIYNVPPVFLFGLVLAWAFQRTGSLVTSGVAHALNNSLAIATMVWR